jgi:CRISPR/Cas system-associated protein endoribonuclease Cas2
MNKLASDQLTNRLVHTMENDGDIRLRAVDNKFFAKEAVVLLGQL